MLHPSARRLAVAFLALGLSAGPTSAQSPSVKTAYDRFKDETTVTLDPMPILRSTAPFVELDLAAVRIVRHTPSRDRFRDEVDQYPTLVFVVRTTDLRFQTTAQELIFLGGGQRLVKKAGVVENTSKSRRAGDPPVSPSNPYRYRLEVRLFPDEFKGLVDKKAVDARLGDVEFTLAKPELDALRVFGAANAPRR
jgi:hypothetical protein